ncbi:MAG: hypothetical protein QOI73_2718 [Solirubrobacteraceae bacterium]|nr:hypothetical protein [Solirubrobacteraceae bacterium]
MDLDDESTKLWLGHAPFTVYEPAFGHHSVYINQGSDLDQYRYQLGHEAFHRVCGLTRHWVHEMLAELLTFARLREAGHSAHAAWAEARWVTIAPAVSLDVLHLWSGGGDPASYARAYVVGQELVELCGWERTCELVHFYDHQWRPDPERWADALPADSASEARRIMGL